MGTRSEGPTVPWETQFNELVQYKAKHGDCNVPRKQGQFGRWVDKQRFNYKKGKLSQDRINRLNGIGFDWTPGRGGSRKGKAPPSTRKQSLPRKERLLSPSTDVDSPSAIDGASGSRNTPSVLSLKVQPKRSDDHNCWTE